MLIEFLLVIEKFITELRVSVFFVVKIRITNHEVDKSLACLEVL